MNVEWLDVAFLNYTNHHHTAELPDLAYTSWSQGRETPLVLCGPEVTEAMAKMWPKRGRKTAATDCMVWNPQPLRDGKSTLAPSKRAWSFPMSASRLKRLR